MMSAQRDSRLRLPALTYPAISTETAAPGWLLDGQRAPFSSCWIACPDSGLACLPSREDDVLALHGSTLCRANLARGLRVHLAGHVTRDG
jgi:hypothetical protein